MNESIFKVKQQMTGEELKAFKLRFNNYFFGT